ncbi:MAG: BamA/TamA family outer membrane protein, partial [Bacteroidales bacterium]|nr:BamA/TamA family outer membrane protein [Bacteroidales bacterium]
MRKILLIVNLLMILFFMLACKSSPQSIKKPYLVKNKIEVNNKKLEVSELYSLMVQKPSSGLFGSAYKFRIYENKLAKKDSRWNRWVKKAFGAPPLYHDLTASETSIRQIKRYLENKGYFNSRVKYRVKEKGKNKIHMIYDVQTNEPYFIKRIKYQIDDPSLERLLNSSDDRSILEPGMQYDAYLLDDERERITTLMRNNGYYYFNKEFIRYEIDSTFGDRSMELKLRVNKATQSITKDSSILVAHKKYRINDIYIYPEFNPNDELETYDTLKFNYKFHAKDTTLSHIFYVYNRPLKVKPMALAHAVMFKSGDLFNNNNLRRSYSRFSGMNITKYVNIDFVDQSFSQDSIGRIDCRIRQNYKKVHSIANGTEVTNSAGNPGVALNLVYQNRNFIRGAESFNITATGALEAQQQQFTEGEESAFFTFNTVEAGIQANLAVPRFMLPITPGKLSADFQPQTNFTLGYNYQKRRDYTRYITNFSVLYKWKQNEKITHNITPWELNSVKIYITNDEFSDRLADFDKRFREQYTDHLISAFRYSFLLNTQQRKQASDYELFKWRIETSGNIINGFNQLFDSPMDDNGDYSILNIRYAQYIRTDFDYRHYNILTPDQTLAFRAVFGIGIPYSNSDALPFEKAFAVGGANGMRGWQIRSLGPGGYSETTADRFDRVGDIHLEVNSEYRFPIHGSILGAVFADAGNVWLLNESSAYPNGNFKFDSFYKQIALDAGIGIRYDMSFFIIRLDMAIPLHDPGEPGNKWVG